MVTYCSLGAQTTIIGMVADRSGEPLVGANVSVGQTGVVTDLDGRYEVVIRSRDTVLFSYIGYQDLLVLGEDLMTDADVVLQAQDLILEATTITASRYQQRVSDATVSVDILSPQLVSATNTINIDDALSKVSGVQVIGGQANIRGGSGFSYGAGSRVMLLIDDLPALQVDAGFTNWGDIPVENIGQIEVVKGAASSLYGSAALNGIINIRTAEPSSEPTTIISAGYTRYDQMGDSLPTWYEDTARYNYVFSAVHRQRIGKLDLSASLFHTRDENYNRFTFKNRNRAHVKLGYRLTDRLKIGVNTLINTGDNGDFFLFFNAQTAPLDPFPGTVSTQQNQRIFIDPYLRYQDKRGNSHRLFLRRHLIDNSNNANQGNKSATSYAEYQFASTIEAINLDLTAGLMSSLTTTEAELFGDTTFTTQVAAAYIQTDYSPTDKLSFSAGLRYEYNRQVTPEMFNGLTVEGGEIVDARPVARLGMRYKAAKYTNVRASWGQGYRFPTVTERFISTVFGSFALSPNPDLRPERGWTAEVGVKQGLSFFGMRGYADLAVFTSQYSDMMEFLAGEELSLTFTSQNVGETSIYGAELSLFGQTDIGSGSLQLFGGYTYVDPRYLNFDDNEMLRSTLSSGLNVLKYRSKHNAKMDAQYDYGGLSIGFAVNYASHIVNVDRVFELVDGFFVGQPFDIIGMHAFRNKYNKGYLRYDSRISYTYKNYKLSLLVNNLTNTVYSLRPGLIEPPRSFGARVDVTL
jgi:iron complex outermembrane receptor protein